MIAINLVKIAFALKAISAAFGGIIVNLFDKFLPDHFRSLFRSGRYGDIVKTKSRFSCQVPKCWFRHFYAFAAPYSIAVLSILCYRYIFNNKLPDGFDSIFKLFLGSPLNSLIPAENSLLAMFIFCIHCFKRYHETHYVNIFSDTSMDIFIYIVGLSHYFGSIMSIVGETQDIVTDKPIYLDWTRLALLDYACAGVFLISTYLQYRSNIILSNLRRDKSGIVITKEHKIPTGELFEYITSPLQFTEIILYLCLSIILRSSSTFHYVTVWVLVNQVECAYLAHEWALRKFENYPKSRKILVPFVF